MKKFIILFILFACSCSRPDIKTQQESIDTAVQAYEYMLEYCEVPDSVKKTILENIKRMQETLDKMKK